MTWSNRPSAPGEDRDKMEEKDIGTKTDLQKWAIKDNNESTLENTIGTW